MPRGRNYYEPVVEQQASPMRGFGVEITGTYILLDDIVTALREYADANDTPHVAEAAEWLRSGPTPAPHPDLLDENYDTVTSQTTQGVDRVEVFPDDPENPRPRWIARACSSGGDILFNITGSFDQEYVLRDVGDRWPGVPVMLVTDAMVDTVWEERDPGGIRSASTKRRRPSPKRLWQ